MSTTGHLQICFFKGIPALPFFLKALLGYKLCYKRAPVGYIWAIALDKPYELSTHGLRKVSSLTNLPFKS